MKHTVKCLTPGCRNHITLPHRDNDYDLWCYACHANARGPDPIVYPGIRASTRRNFMLRVARDGHARRGGRI
jgi:hypothetical protein